LKSAFLLIQLASKEKVGFNGIIKKTISLIFMVRPRMCRRLRFNPQAHYFKPRGIPMKQLEEVSITKEEMEAVKLKDYDGLEQIEAAQKMNTSQSTFQRILSSARTKIAEAIVKGKALRIEE